MRIGRCENWAGSETLRKHSFSESFWFVMKQLKNYRDRISARLLLHLLGQHDSEG